MFQLLQKQPYHTITIKYLTEQAQLSRQTFYAIFSDREEVIRAGLQAIFEEYQKALTETDLTVHQLVKLFFEFYQKHARIIDSLIDNHLETLLIDISKECMTKLQLSDRPESDYRYGFISAGLIQLISDWHRQEENVSLEQLALLTENLLNPMSLSKPNF